ncbi:GntR family transcriptional regulator [Mameliella sp.]|uniref:GntR family transcriptional regulator n=1 Tax=Mameliella sp. TaxID=1924940 RepID=UPI003B50A0F1
MSWRDCFGHFRQEIREGRIAPGSRLPSLAEVEARFGLTRFGARRVIEALRAEGLVHSWQGRGNYVAERPLRFRVSSTTRFSTNVRRDGRSGRVEILDCGMRRAPDEVAAHLGITVGTAVPFALLLGYIEDRPAVLGQHSFAPDLPENLLDALAHRGGSVSQALADTGFSGFHRHNTLFEARLPTRHDALTLDIPPLQPVMVTTALNVSSKDGRILELSRAVARADLVAYEVPTTPA